MKNTSIFERALSLIMIFILVLSFSGCSARTKNKQNLVADLEKGITTLDPGFLRTLSEQYVACNLWEGLVRKNVSGSIEPGIAEGWEISEDGLRYIFHLRKNARWSDGKPVTAEQFEYAWKRALDPNHESAVAFMLYFLKNGQAYNKKEAKIDDVGVKTLDDSTLEVTLEKPAPYFLEILNYHTYYPVRSDIIKKNPDSWCEKAYTLVSDGPFYVEELDENKEIRTLKNPYYWDTKNVKLDSVSFQMVRTEDDAATWKKYLDGNIDFGYLFPDDDNFDKLSEITTKRNNVISQNSLATFYLCFNSSKKPFNDIRVRQAFEMALDKKGYTDFRKKAEEVAAGFVPPGIPDAEPGTDFRRIGGEFMHKVFSKDNVNKAKKLLSEAGYSNPKDFPTVVILANNQPDIKYIEKQWEENLGVNVEVDLCQGKLFSQRKEEQDFDIVMNNWIADFADPISFLGFLATEKAFNGLFPADYYTLVEESNSLANNSERLAVLHNAEKVLLDSYTLIPLFFRKDVYYIKPYVKNYLKTPLAEIYFRNAYIEK